MLFDMGHNLSVLSQIMMEKILHVTFLHVHSQHYSHLVLVGLK